MNQADNWRSRFARSIAFMQARLAPDNAVGLRLTVGAVLLIGFAWLFGGLAEDVVTGAPLTVLDVQVAQWFNQHASLGWTRVMLVVSDLNDVLPISIMAALTAAVLAWKRAWSWLLMLALTVPGGMLINLLMKFAFHRVRPTFEHPLLVLTSYSFPSGHVSGATLFYGFLAAAVIVGTRGVERKAMAVMAAAALIALVALSRVSLGAHYLSDVLAAFAASTSWLTWCVIVTGLMNVSRARPGAG